MLSGRSIRIGKIIVGENASWRGIGDKDGRHPGRTHEFGDGALRFEDGAFSRVAGAAPGSVSVEVCGPPVTCWIGPADDLVVRATVFWHF
jgi:hypothetical protein